MLFPKIGWPGRVFRFNNFWEAAVASISSTTDLMEERDWDFRREGYQPDISPKRDGYLPTAEQAEERVRRDSLDTRIVLVAQNFKQATYDIDRCIRATVPSDRKST